VSLSTISPPLAPPSPEEDAALAAIRRASVRANAFTLLVAVCNSPARRDSLIERLSESLSDSLRVVTVPPDCSDVLELVCRSTAPGEDGPIVVIGLEKGIIAEDFKHPRIAALNHRRDQWRQSIPQPVLFWLPEYLLATLARGAPDFLDWRAGTFLFVDHASVARQERIFPADSC
jgi:hypothetical protein